MDKLRIFYPEGHEAHFEPGHPERPERIEAIRRALEETGWWESIPQTGSLALTEGVLEAVHSPGYLAALEAAAQHSRRLDMDTYTTRASWDLALKAAGGAAAIAADVWRGEAKSGLALCRPPGHHATRSRGMGFCLLNNIAIAAETLLQHFGARHLAIVDLDLHHGNGTQDIFYQRGEVFFISTHQYPFYPGTGDLDETGAGDGEGTTANLPLPAGSGDQAFHTAMEEMILPLLDRSEAQMLLVSVGYDPHWRDPLGSLLLSVGGYQKLLKSLIGWADEHCGGRIALFLEGGYDLEVGASYIQATVAAFLNQPWRDSIGPSPIDERMSWRANLERAKKIWEL